jgi:hypothetical protein
VGGPLLMALESRRPLRDRRTCNLRLFEREALPTFPGGCPPGAHIRVNRLSRQLLRLFGRRPTCTASLAHVCECAGEQHACALVQFLFFTELPLKVVQALLQRRSMRLGLRPGRSPGPRADHVAGVRCAGRPAAHRAAPGARRRATGPRLPRFECGAAAPWPVRPPAGSSPAARDPPRPAGALSVVLDGSAELVNQLDADTFRDWIARGSIAQRTSSCLMPSRCWDVIRDVAVSSWRHETPRQSNLRVVLPRLLQDNACLFQYS